jgi:hypothetical protein
VKQTTKDMKDLIIVLERQDLKEEKKYIDISDVRLFDFKNSSINAHQMRSADIIFFKSSGLLIELKNRYCIIKL